MSASGDAGGEWCARREGKRGPRTRRRGSVQLRSLPPGSPCSCACLSSLLLSEPSPSAPPSSSPWGCSPRRQVLIWLMVIFTVGHVVAVLAPTFAVLVASRVVSALTHGAYFGASALVARQLAAPGRQGQA